MKKLLLLVLLMAPVMLWAQRAAQGKLIDAENNEPLIGAAVTVDGTTQGTVSDLDGSFKLSVADAESILIIRLVGYKETRVTLPAGKDANLGAVRVSSDAIGISEVSVVASIGIARKTPVAISTISGNLISEKLGTQEFPEILKLTPSVYATKEGGGFGDGRVNIRGFSSANVAVMVNGVPVNDMEWGGIYWSNWAGLGDVTRGMQVQRGLGASKISAPSVGGSINILTNTTEAKKGGSMSYGMGNDGYQKMAFSVSSGLNDEGWAFSLLGAKTWGDGYVVGTEFESYTYFANISKIVSSSHTLSLTAFGAPQWHNQRSSYDKRTIDQWQTYSDGYRFNATYGFGINGQRKTSAKNFYHKPQISLNDYWTISPKTSLTTSLYYSFGQGGGYGAKGANSGALYGSGSYRTIDDQLDYSTIMEENSANIQGSQAIISSSNNNHKWAGLLSNLNTKLNDNLDLSGGVDVRYYIGDHNRTIADLMGGDFFVDPERKNVMYRNTDESYLYEKLTTGDVISRNYLGYVLSEGAFGQLEYNHEKLSAFVSGAISNTTYWRHDKMYYSADNADSKKISFLGWSAKGGANYNISNTQNAYVNVGYFTRAPFFSSVFLATDVSNAINNDAVNENVYSAEVGYGFRTQWLRANVNGYYTFWENKTLAGSIDSQNPDLGRYNAQGVNALHKGVELDLELTPVKRLTITGMASVGDWTWVDDVDAYAFNKEGQMVDSKGNAVADIANAYKVKLDIGGVHVGDAAQTTAAAGVNYEFFKGLKMGIDYTYFARLFADPGKIQTLKGTDTWEVPDAGVFDLMARYRFKIGDLNASFNANVNNLLNTEYISDADSGTSGTWKDATVFYGFGRTYSCGLKVNF